MYVKKRHENIETFQSRECFWSWVLLVAENHNNQFSSWCVESKFVCVFVSHKSTNNTEQHFQVRFIQCFTNQTPFFHLSLQSGKHLLTTDCIWSVSLSNHMECFSSELTAWTIYRGYNLNLHILPLTLRKMFPK